MKARDDGELAKLSMLDEFARALQFISKTLKEVLFDKNMSCFLNFFKTEMFTTEYFIIFKFQ